MNANRLLTFSLTSLLLGTLSTYARDQGLDAARGGPNRTPATVVPGGASHPATAIVQPSGGFNRGPANFSGAPARNPMTGSQIPSPQSFSRPANVPITRLVTPPSFKPSTANIPRTVTGITTIPSTRAVTGITTIPSTRPVTGITTIPSTRPGNVTYPSLLPSGRSGFGANKTVTGLTTIPKLPGTGGNKAITGLPNIPKHPGIGGNLPGNKLPGFIRPGLKPGTISGIAAIHPGITHPGITHPFSRPPGTLAIHPWWGGNAKGGHQSGNIAISNNFKHNWNWSLNKNNWGYRPWWNQPTYYPWYGGHWNYGWNYHHNHWNNWYTPYPSAWPGYAVDDDWFGWGLPAWGLGDLIYQLGYLSYANPYPVTPIVVSPEITISYDQPMASAATATAPGNEAAAQSAEEQSQAVLEESRAAFKNNDYLAALPLADRAVSLLPGDSVLHEYRALVLFALGKYSDCAGVLNSILASGPGWNWSTMIQLYDSQDTYTAQLHKLENYVKGNPHAADARFVLGYHYMVCGYLDKAAATFKAVTKLQPADTVAKQLYDLCSSSTKPGESSADAEEDDSQSHI